MNGVSKILVQNACQYPISAGSFHKGKFSEASDCLRFLIDSRYPALRSTHRENQYVEEAAINTIGKRMRSAGGFFVSELRQSAPKTSHSFVFLARWGFVKLTGAIPKTNLGNSAGQDTAAAVA